MRSVSVGASVSFIMHSVIVDNGYVPALCIFHSNIAAVIELKNNIVAPYDGGFDGAADDFQSILAAEADHHLFIGTA